MRTNIVIDDDLIKEVLKATGLKSKREAVNKGLKELLRRAKQKQGKRFFGTIAWEGNLDEMRRD